MAAGSQGNVHVPPRIMCSKAGLPQAACSLAPAAAVLTDLATCAWHRGCWYCSPQWLPCGLRTALNCKAKHICTQSPLGQDLHHHTSRHRILKGPCGAHLQGGGRTQLEDMLHTSYAHHLFARGEYEEAMAQFGMCSYSNPIVLLRLFPSLASWEMLEPVAHQVPGQWPG